MERRGERGRLHDRGAAAGLDEGHFVVPANLVGDPDAVVERQQIGADAKQNVLAVVDDFAGAGMFPGGGAATEEGTLLEEGDAEALVGEGAGGGESGETASGDGDCGLGSGGHSQFGVNVPTLFRRERERRMGHPQQQVPPLRSRSLAPVGMTTVLFVPAALVGMTKGWASQGAFEKTFPEDAELF